MHTQPVEDIDAVIGRFQAWAGSRSATETKPGIRELSYEEALQSHLSRWKGGKAAQVKNTRTAGQHTDKLKEEPGVMRVPAPDAIAARSAARGPGKARHMPAPAKTHEARHSTAKKVRAGTYASKASRESASANVPAAKRPAVAKQEAKAAPRPMPQFKEVLANAVRPTEVIVSAQPSELARQVAISIRLAPSERALLRTRAAEAGITVSAYIRQCALEVEQLRAQVKQTLAAMEYSAKAPGIAPEPPPMTRPGLLTRLMRRFFPASSPTLVLRA